MKKILIVAMVISINLSSYAQKVIKEKVLFPSGKSLGLIGPFGLKSAVNGAGPSNNYNLTPSLELTDVKNDGFILRKDYTFTKYNNDLEEQWETKIDKVYGLQSMPYSYTIGDEKGVYFIQISNNPAKFNQLHITRFDSKGQIVETRFTTNKLFDGISTYFLTKDGLSLLLVKVGKKEKKVNYSLVSFSAKDLSSNIKDIKLETDDYELKWALQDKGEYLWSDLITTDSKTILIKSYFKDIEGSKLKEMILKTIEMTPSGIISNPKNYTFEPTTIADTRYYTPTIEFDTLHNELYAFGLMKIESKNFINGLYVNKFDYKNTSALYRKEFEFSNFTQYIPDNSVRDKIHFTMANVFPISTFIKNTKLLDMEKQELRLLLFNDSKGLLKNQVKMTGVRLGKDGSLNYVEDVLYKNNLGLFNPQYLIPEQYTIHWKSPNYIAKGLSWDFLNGLTSKMDPNYVVCNIFTKKGFDIITYVREKDGEIKAFKLEK